MNFGFQLRTQNSESFNIIAEGIDWEYPMSPACCDHIKRIANNGFDELNTANGNLDGTGAIVDILTAANNGTSLETVFIKGKGNTTEGMIRLFISNDSGVTYFLFSEIQIPANLQTAIVPSTLNYTKYYSLIVQDTFILAASTQKTELFSVTMNSMDWTY